MEHFSASTGLPALLFFICYSLEFKKKLIYITVTNICHKTHILITSYIYISTYFPQVFEKSKDAECSI